MGAGRAAGVGGQHAPGRCTFAALAGNALPVERLRRPPVVKPAGRCQAGRKRCCTYCRMRLGGPCAPRVGSCSRRPQRVYTGGMMTSDGGGARALLQPTYAARARHMLDRPQQTLRLCNNHWCPALYMPALVPCGVGHAARPGRPTGDGLHANPSLTLAAGADAACAGGRYASWRRARARTSSSRRSSWAARSASPTWACLAPTGSRPSSTRRRRARPGNRVGCE